MRTLPLLTLVFATTAVGTGCQSGASFEPPPDPVTSLRVLPSATSLDGGTSLRLSARIRQPDGSITSPPDVAWSSADSDIASVDAAGMVSGLRAGRVQIVATWHGHRGSSVVTVLEPVAKKPNGKTPGRQCLEKATAGAAIPTCL
jgi:uncharacterized protein YjdB